MRFLRKTRWDAAADGRPAMPQRPLRQGDGARGGPVEAGEVDTSGGVEDEDRCVERLPQLPAG